MTIGQGIFVGSALIAGAIFFWGNGTEAEAAFGNGGRYQGVTTTAGGVGIYVVDTETGRVRACFAHSCNSWINED